MYAVCHEDLPTGSHLPVFVEKFWQPKMNQKNWDNIYSGLSSNPSVAKEEWTSSAFIDHRAKLAWVKSDKAQLILAQVIDKFKVVDMS